MDARVWKTAGIGALAAGLVTAAALVTSSAAPTPPGAPAVKAKPKFTLACAVDARKAPAKDLTGNPVARKAAQRGLDFLAREATAWTTQNNCFGCHVQAVTVEAFAVGKRHQYHVEAKDFSHVLGGMLTVNGGARHPGGLGHGSPSIARAAKVFGAASFARYDQWVAADLRDDLLSEARHLIGLQQTDGSIVSEWVNPPVGTGPVQYTAQAIIAWKQAYERSADDEWLTAIQKAEDYLRTQAGRWNDTSLNIQEINYTAMGLLAAGMGAREDLRVSITKKLLARQNQDGGWSFVERGASEAFPTGQTLYVLRLLGMNDKDSAVSRGTKWLIGKQAEDGGWSHAGFGKAEAMWGVLGLVSIDVLTVSLAGLQDGQHVKGAQRLTVEARDNGGTSVTKVEIDVDDLPVSGACAASHSFAWDTTDLAPGKHVVEVRATNARGEVSRRRFEVFAGDHYLTQIGSRWSDGGTEISLRDIADPALAHRVELEVVALDKHGKATGKPLYTQGEKGRQGALRFHWKGAKAGKYLARLAFVDDGGKVRHREEMPFVHDAPEAQKRDYAQIEGAARLPGDAPATNVEMELVDDDGNVVARTRSTGSGQYKFKNVDANKKYRIQVKKDGYMMAEPAPVAPVRAGESKAADVKLQAH